MRLRLAFLLLAALLGGRAAHSQGLASPVTAAYSTPGLRASAAGLAGPATLDTAAALHRYFARRRHNGHVALGVGAGLLVIGYTVAAANNKGGYGTLVPFALGALGVVASAPLLVRGAVLTVAYSKRREQRVFRHWQQQRLPARWCLPTPNPKNGGSSPFLAQLLANRCQLLA